MNYYGFSQFNYWAQSTTIRRMINQNFIVQLARNYSWLKSQILRFIWGRIFGGVISLSNELSPGSAEFQVGKISQLHTILHAGFSASQRILMIINLIKLASLIYSSDLVYFSTWIPKECVRNLHNSLISEI